MTSGGGEGMVSTRATAPFESAWGSKDHGKSSRAVRRNQPACGLWWTRESFGTNG